MILRALFCFIVSFIAILIINQIGYGGCFKSYCVEAALPKVFFLSSIITGLFICFLLSDESTTQSKANSDLPPLERERVHQPIQPKPHYKEKFASYEANQSTLRGNSLEPKNDPYSIIIPSKVHQQSYAKWSLHDVNALIDCMIDGLSESLMASKLNRTPGAIRSRLKKIRQSNWLVFNTFSEASLQAKRLSKKYCTTIRVISNSSNFFINLHEINPIRTARSRCLPEPEEDIFHIYEVEEDLNPFSLSEAVDAEYYEEPYYLSEREEWLFPYDGDDCESNMIDQSKS